MNITLCIYCNKNADKFVSMHCCHTIDTFVKIFTDTRTNHPNTLNDFIYTQPYNLVKYAIISIDPSYKDKNIPINVNKMKKILFVSL